MSAMCPNCQNPIQASDTFCSQCGTSLGSRTETPQDFHPVPGVVGQPDMRIHRKRRKKKKPLYRRPWFLTLAIVAALVIVGSASALFYVNSRFEDINSVSTPPPVVSIADTDDGEASKINTDPAQQALEIAQAGKTGSFTINLPSGSRPAAASGTSPVAHSSVASAPGIGEEPALVSSPGPEEVVDLTGTPVPEMAQEPATFTLKPIKQTANDSVNILLMGVDARPGEAIDTGVRPDSLSVLHLNAETGSCRILSVPRDIRTELPGYGQTKINHALAVGGIPYERLVVEQLLGIKIDHYGLIDFSGTEGLVDAVGGVTVTNPKAFEASGHAFPEGELTLNGEEALAYARFRYDEQGDFGRQGRQQQIIRALISETDGMDIVRGANTLLGAVDGHFKTDLSPKQMIDLARDYRSSCTSSTLETDHIDGAVETLPDPMFHMDLSYVIVDPTEVATKVDWLLGGK